jgi:hypothetical protein
VKIYLHQITDTERKLRSYIIAFQMFSKNRKNIILIGLLTQDVQKEYQANFLCLRVFLDSRQGLFCYLCLH